MTAPRPKGWRIGLALTPQATPPGWAVGLRFAEQSIPDADQLTPGGALPLAALGFAGTLTAAFTERSSTDLTPSGTLPAPALGFTGTLTAAFTGRSTDLAPGGQLPLAALGFAGSIAAAYDSGVQRPLVHGQAVAWQQAQTLPTSALVSRFGHAFSLQPGGTLPLLLPAFAGTLSGRYAERAFLAPGGALPLALGFTGRIATEYDSRVQRPLARFARAETFRQAQPLGSSVLAAVMQDAHRASAQVRDVVQQAQAMAAQVQGTAQQARSLPAQVRDTAQQAQPLRQRSTSAFEVAKPLHHALQEQAQQAQRLPVVAMVYAWQIADPRRGQHLERFEQAGIQRHMGLRVPPVYVLGPGWRIALEFAPQFAVPRTWGELQTAPLLSGAGLAHHLAQPTTGVRYQDAMRPGPALVKKPWPPGGGGGTDPESPEHPIYIIPLLRVYMTVHELSAVLLPSGDEVTLRDVTISTDDDAYCWSLGASGPVHLLDQLAPVGGLPQRVQVTIDGIDFVFVITRLERSRSFAQQRVQLQGSSVASLLAAPYMPPGLWRNDAAPITAAQLALAPLEFTGVGIDWQITDWLLPEGAAQLSGTPLQAVLQLAEGVGAVVRSHRTDAQLIIAPRYPVLPWYWGDAVPDVRMPAAVIATDSLAPEPRAAYNSIMVCGGPVGGIRGDVRRMGTSGAPPAPQIQSDLITHIDAARMRGSWALAASGDKLMQTITMPVLTGPSPDGGDYPGILQPGQLLEVADTDTTWRGLVRAVSVSASLPKVRQQIKVERVATV